MLSREEQNSMRAAMQQSVEQSLETFAGECIAVDDLTGQEWGHKWRSGEARIGVCPDEDEDGPEIEYVFQVRVELVAVESPQ